VGDEQDIEMIGQTIKKPASNGSPAGIQLTNFDVGHCCFVKRSDADDSRRGPARTATQSCLSQTIPPPASTSTREPYCAAGRTLAHSQYRMARQRHQVLLQRQTHQLAAQV
jgi:hypothetical protein